MVSHRSLGTPCPVQYGSDAFLTSHENESTLNFTSAFRPFLHSAKPRRPRGSVAFTIHDDKLDQEDQIDIKRRGIPDSARKTGKKQAQTLQSPNVHTTGPSSQMISTIHPLRTSILAQAPKRPMDRLSTLCEGSTSRDGEVKVEKPSPKPFRQARRETLYIPTEDTTMPSMFMGIFSPIKHIDDHAKGRDGDRPVVEMTGIAAQMAMKRGNRKSIIGVAPRRAPLQTSARPLQETVASTDRYGQGGGKENIPPGLEECEKLMLDLKLNGIKEVVVERKPSPRRAVKTDPQLSTRSGAFAPTASSLQRANPLISTRVSTSQPPSSSNRYKPTWRSGSCRRSSQPVSVTVNGEAKPASNSSVYVALKPKVPSRFVVPMVKPESLLDNHALLAENIIKPDMYEDDWLSHQEVAITQLINSLFDSSTVRSTSQDQTGILRQNLLDLYGTDAMLLMYKRLNAALLYGALGIPQEVLDRGDSLYKDLGRKQQFLNLWLQTYDHLALEVALEVVVGRQCRPAKAQLSSISSTLQPISRKALQSFIETFLLCNKDGNANRDATSRDSWSYQRTMHRSLMLIKVLDLVKTTSSIDVPTCLFQSSSTFKSSNAVVQSLFQMLNTSAGDPLRVLSHLDYHVSHVQLPLEEFDYKIENLAIDLRDGTRLTRLVELLLYPSASQNLSTTADPEATTTVIMPEGESLDSQHDSTWPLSQHLRFPCQARAPMLWNVQVALSAIQNVKGMTSLTKGISAEDIVDGYREKTIRLLWALVGKWGLPSLLDWKDLEWEIRRLHLQQQKYYPLQTLSHTHNGDEDDDIDVSRGDFPSFSRCKFLLRQWTHAIASSSRHDIPLQNFTTNFADGRIFEAIVNEYEAFILPPSSASAPFSPLNDIHGSGPTLQSRLNNLGCSSQFSDLFPSSSSSASSVNHHVFSSDFVFVALTFLAARLLPPSKKPRAAIVIQRRWREYWQKLLEKRKNDVKRVVAECVAAVKQREAENQIQHERSRDKVRGDGVISKEEEYDGFGVGVDVGINIDVGNVMSPESLRESDIWLSL